MELSNPTKQKQNQCYTNHVSRERRKGKLMAKFKLEITETLSRDVEVEAETLEEAIAHLKKAYRNEEIILGADDFIAYGINPID